MPLARSTGAMRPRFAPNGHYSAAGRRSPSVPRMPVRNLPARAMTSATRRRTRGFRHSSTGGLPTPPRRSTGVFTRSTTRCPSRCLQQLGGLDVKHGRKPRDDVEPHRSRARLDLAQITPIHVRVMRQGLLREAFLMARSAQIGREYLAQVHGAKEPVAVY